MLLLKSTRGKMGLFVAGHTHAQAHTDTQAEIEVSFERIEENFPGEIWHKKFNLRHV